MVSSFTWSCEIGGSNQCKKVHTKLSSLDTANIFGISKGKANITLVGMV